MFDFNPLHPIPDAQQSSWCRDPPGAGILLCQRGEEACRGPACCPHHSTGLTVPWTACPDSETQTALLAWGMLLGIHPQMVSWQENSQNGDMLTWHRDTEVGFPPPDVGGRCKPGCPPVPMVLVCGFVLARAAAVLCMQRSPGMGRGVCPCSALPVLLPWPACFHFCSQH